MVNKVILLGFLGQDPELRSTGSGAQVANLSMATTEKWKDKSGQAQEETTWHKIIFWGRQAEICGQYLHKGSQLYVEGSIQVRKWQDNEGKDRYSTEIKGREMKMLGSKGSNGNGGGQGNHAPEPTGPDAYGGTGNGVPF